jgi:hypothetical protein
MGGFQHAGDPGTNTSFTLPPALSSAISTNWGGINKKSPVGYISGLPVVYS